MPSLTVENYLKAILQLVIATKSETISTGQLAATVNVSPGSVTSMLKTLAESGLATYMPYEGVSLTKAGKNLALRMLRRHRLIELFLVRTLELTWDQVHEEAENMEHAVSDILIERIDEFLGRPETDPHGDPIPSADGYMRGQRARRLPCRPARRRPASASCACSTRSRNFFAILPNPASNWGPRPSWSKTRRKGGWFRRKSAKRSSRWDIGQPSNCWSRQSPDVGAIRLAPVGWPGRVRGHRPIGWSRPGRKATRSRTMPTHLQLSSRVSVYVFVPLWLVDRTVQGDLGGRVVLAVQLNHGCCLCCLLFKL